VYADRIDANGEGSMLSISLITPGPVTGREKIGFTGTDPYYVLDDFYPGMGQTPMPTAIHAVGEISFITPINGRRVEHPPSLNCDANRRGTDGQSVWDGSGFGGPLVSGCPAWGPTFPTTSKFTSTDLTRVTPKPTLTEQDFQTLKQAARSSGLYCTPGGGQSLSCLRDGAATTISSTIQTNDLGTLATRSNFIVYIEFPSGTDPTAVNNTVKWKAAVGPCSDDPSVNRSMIFIIRNGSLTMQSGAVLTGAVILPEGRFDSEGQFTTHGTIIAKEFWVRGGATFEMSPCWVRNMPGPFLDVTTTRWSEVDR
jgi:hypothetical protein